MTTSPFQATRPPAEWAVRDDDPFIGPERLPAGTDPASVSRFGASRWGLTPLSAGGHSANMKVDWDRTENPLLRSSLRRACWALVNLPTPDELLERAAGTRVRWPSPGTIVRHTGEWQRLAAWLDGKGIKELPDVTVEDMEDYAAYLAGLGRTRAKSRAGLYSISVLWGFAPHLLPGDRIPMPPWEAGAGLRDFLPAPGTPNENTTAPIHPAVMSPLLIWAMRFVDDFAEDILAGWHEHQRLNAQIRPDCDPEAGQRLRTLIQQYAAEGRPLPGSPCKNGNYIADRYLAALANACPRQVKHYRDKYGAGLTVSAEAPLGTQIQGRLHGQPWLRHISFHEAPVLMTRLAAAAMIIVFYLSGVRVGEGLELKAGCCPDPGDDGEGSIRYQIYGNVFKGARDEDGRLIRGGQPRDTPWTVIPPVVRAIRILERMIEGPSLFPLKSPWTNPAVRLRRRAGDVLSAAAAAKRIEAFSAYANQLASQHDLAAERIPGDPDGPVVLSRFRRTVAWHIARLPGGRIALATQYGHLRASAVTDGYGGRARQGLRRVLDIETARSMADYLGDLAERIADGEGVSGPAAPRMIKAARDASTRFEGMFLTPKQADALLDDPQLTVYDNPAAFLTCNYDPAKALCHPQRAGGKRNLPPAIDRCDPACANITRTDAHIAGLRAEIAGIGKEIASPLTPTPIRERLRQRAAALQAIADRHQRTRTTQARPGTDPAAGL